MKISEQDLTTDEMLALLNETSISVIIESSGRIITANQFFCDLVRRGPDELLNTELNSFLDDESNQRITELKSKILENFEKDQTVRIEDRQLRVNLKAAGRELRCLMSLVLLSGTPSPKWGHQLAFAPWAEGESARLEKMEKLKDSLLNLSQSLVQIKDIRSFFDLVLEAADSTITQGEYCTILKLIDGDTFVPVAARGYSWNIMADFKLPVRDSYSYLMLGHIIDRTLLIEDIDELYKHSRCHVKVKGHDIGSSLQTPIFFNDELYGILTIDSTRAHVFTEDDFNTIEYLRTQIQIALENQLLYHRIMHQASHDELTDVASRGAFEEQVIKFLRTRHHYESCCIILMDLNDLKVVNDVWGHSAGDKYLLGFISAMQKHMRGSDLLARLGGDEFAICFFSSQSAHFIERIEEIQQHFIDDPLHFEGNAVSCYFSYGIAHCPEDGESYDVLINTADTRMYNMKAKLKKQHLKNDLHEFRV